MMNYKCEQRGEVRSLVEFVFRSVGEFFEISFGLSSLFWFGVKEETFLINHCLKQFFSRLEVVPAPVKRLLANRLLVLFMQTFKIWMCQTLLNSVPFVRVESQHFGQQICSRGLNGGEKFVPALFGPFGKGLDVFDGIIIS